MAKQDQRNDPGSDIMIHGKAVSVGCLAMGDAAAEELFALSAWTGRKQVRIIIAPTDFRRLSQQESVNWPLAASFPKWVPHLYEKVYHALQVYAK